MSSPVPWADAKALLQTALATVPATIPIAWPNVAFANPSPPTIWISVDSVGRSLEQIELGGRSWQEEGTLYVYIMAPAGFGTEQSRQLAKTITNGFRNLGPRDVVYYAACIGQGNRDETDGSWWIMPVTIDWRWQDHT